MAAGGRHFQSETCLLLTVHLSEVPDSSLEGWGHAQGGIVT